MRAWKLVLRRAAGYWDDARRDTGYALTLLGRAPGFSVAAVLCLALGTGLATAVFTQVQSTVLAELPGRPADPASLVRAHRPVSLAEYEALREDAPAVAQLAAYVSQVPVAVARPDGTLRRRVWGQLVTPNYFQILGIRPTAGRLFGSEERVEGATVVVIADRFWRTEFDGAESVVGGSIRVNGQLVTVIGVASPGFAGASPMTGGADIWIPTTAAPSVAPELAVRQDRRARSMQLVGRLLNGVSVERAEVAFETIVGHVDPIIAERRTAADDVSIRLLPGGRMWPVRDEDLPRTIGFPVVLVLLVLAMACGNVANMVLARGANRLREFSLRLALGASGGRIVRQLMTESLILSLLGSVGGGLVAAWLLSLFGRMRPVVPEYVQYDVSFHWGAYALTALAASLSTVFFSLAPSIRAGRLDIQSGLKPVGPSAIRRFRRLGVRNLVVYQQVALSVVLLLLTGLIVVGWNRAASVDLGFRPERLHFLNVDPIRDGRSPADASTVVKRLHERLRSTPGIESVSIAQTVPLAMSGSELTLSVKTDLVSGTNSLGAVRVDRVGAGFFESVGTSLVRGRDFREVEHSNDSRVVIVNETMARMTWPNADALGQSLRTDDEPWEVVGVVRDTRSAFPLSPVLPAVYRPITPAAYEAPAKNGVTLAVRTAPGVEASGLLVEAVRAVDQELSVVGIRPLTQEVDQAMFLARVATAVYGGMGVFGLVLAAVGLGGVTAYAVARRTREIGIRMALGAERGNVLRLVLREGACIAVAGTITGTLLALLVMRALSGIVETLAEMTRTTMTDPALVVGGPALLLAFALVACLIPARRATRVDPVAALRSE